MQTHSMYSNSQAAASKADPSTLKIPGHWLLARLGKRVLRPGGLKLTKDMLRVLAIGRWDSVVEFAPGLGITAQLALAKQPANYIAIERDQAAAEHVGKLFKGTPYHCKIGNAEDTKLDSESATVVYGEAMLSMQTLEQKRRIIKEAHRLLKPGGRYGIHELYMEVNDEKTRQAIRKDMSQTIHVGVQPLTMDEWLSLLESEGFEVSYIDIAPLHLLEPKRMIEDEGLFRTLQIASRLLCDSDARKRVFQMRSIFRRYKQNLGAVVIVCKKS